MRRRGRLGALLAALAGLALPLALQAEVEPDRRAMVFCVDVSGSMRQGELLKRLQAEMVRFVRDPTKLKPGDWFTLITFGSKVSLVEDRRIRGPEDIARIERTIRSLEPGEAYTYVTKALDLMVTQMKKLQDADYGDQTLAYLFTDGKNDPPPSVRNPLSFADIARRWSLQTELAASDLFIYLVTMGIRPERGLRQVQQKFPRQIKIVTKARVPSKSARMIPPAPIRLRYVPGFTPRLHQQRRLELPVAVEVLDLSEHDGQQVQLRLETRPAVKVQPAHHRLVVRRGGREVVPFALLGAQAGKHRLLLHASTERGAVKVLPASSSFDLEVLRPAVAVRIESSQRRAPRAGGDGFLSLSIAATSADGQWDGKLALRAEAPYNCPLEPARHIATIQRGQPTEVVFRVVRPAEGEHALTFHLEAPSGAEVSPGSYQALLRVQPPSRWLRSLALTAALLLLLILGTGVTQLVLFPRFPESYVLENDAGEQWRLRIHQPVWGQSISARDLAIDDAQFELLAHNTKEVFVRSSEREEWHKVVVGDEIHRGYRVVEIPLTAQGPGRSA